MVLDLYGTDAVVVTHLPANAEIHLSEDIELPFPSFSRVLHTFGGIAPWRDLDLETHGMDNPTALGLYWRSGDGDIRHIMNSAGMSETVEVRLQRLQRMEVDIKIQARHQAQRMREVKVPSKPPSVVPKPDVLKLLKVHPQLLDWTYFGQTRVEFLSSWNSYKRSGEAAKVGERMLCWYFTRCKEKMYPEDYAAITRAQQSWTAAQADDREPEDVVALADYLQYTLDLGEWRVRADKWKSSTNDECDKLVHEASLAWKREHSIDIETARWDWCPMWDILRTSVFMQHLPPLPWKHNGDEATRVRETLTLARFQRVSPPPCVFILRLAVHLQYGKWRQFCCPRVGVTDDLLRCLSRNPAAIHAAASSFVAECTFLYAGIIEEDVLHIRENFLRDIDVVNQGGGEEFLNSAKHWVSSVQVRALQDLAIQLPEIFDACWITTAQCNWLEQAMHWQRMLRFREGLDIGWVPEKETPQWANRTRQSRITMQCNARALLTAIREDNDDQWASCTQKRSVMDLEDGEDHTGSEPPNAGSGSPQNTDDKTGLPHQDVDRPGVRSMDSLHVKDALNPSVSKKL